MAEDWTSAFADLGDLLKRLPVLPVWVSASENFEGHFRHLPAIRVSQKQTVNDGCRKSQFSNKFASQLINLSRGDFCILSFSTASTLN